MSIRRPIIPPGLRVYAIGDIHGRLDLLVSLREKITEDQKTTDAKIQKIFLGDYIDRGIHSREIIDYMIAWLGEESPAPIFLLGNHELVMRNILDQSNESLLMDWMQYGGRETLMSYGIKPSSFMGDGQALITEFAEKVPGSHRDFLARLKTSASFGDYFFCHAGVNPGIDLSDQTTEDLVWIRSKFLSYTEPHAKMIVHGHSISLEAEFMPNRIGIDTGAYATGKLTALGLEDTEQWLIQTS
jgi:serine/threonine protein phosphatase 1